jgi:hypothetical protein
MGKALNVEFAETLREDLRTEQRDKCSLRSLRMRAQQAAPLQHFYTKSFISTHLRTRSS